MEIKLNKDSWQGGGAGGESGFLQSVGSIELYTDGSKIVDRNVGGWAFMIKVDGIKKIIRSGSYRNVSAARMELMAVFKGLNYMLDYDFFDYKNIIIMSDSSYVVNGINRRMKKWRRKRWTASHGRSLSNIDLWKPIIFFSDLVNLKAKRLRKPVTRYSEHRKCHYLANYEARNG